MRYVLLLLLAGCVSQPVVHHPSSESWDQENLKQNDHGCPSAVFIAPGGELQQCGVTIRPYKPNSCYASPDFGGINSCQYETRS